MKKLILISFILFTLTLSSIIGVNAAPVYDDFDFTVYDNEKYDLLTGFKSTDDLYSITNKIHLDKDLIADEVIFSNDDFHHVLFFNEFNAYLGYVNTDKSDLQLSTWINGDVAIDGSLNIPNGVDKIALMNYNYDELRDNIIYENEDIDNIAWDSLSYRDIFEGNNLILNPTFETTDDWFGTLGIFSIVDYEGELNGYTSAASLQTIRQTAIPDIIINGNEYYVSVDTLYPVYYESFHISQYTAAVFGTFLDYTDDITEMTTFNDTFIADDGDSDYIFFIYEKGSPIDHGDDVYIDNVYLYDLTDIFTSNLPDATEFQTMKLYYDTYINAVDEISYNDIYSNSLIENGNFKSDITGFSSLFALSFVWSDDVNTGAARIRGDGVNTSFLIKDNGFNVNVDNIYYIRADFYNNTYATLNYLQIQDNGAPYSINNVESLDVSSYAAGWNTLSGLWVSNTNFNQRLLINFAFPSPYLATTFWSYADNVMVFNLSSIFGYVDDDITNDWIELHYQTWLDPYGDAYTVYYPAANLITLDIDYSWDDTPAADPDAITSIDEGLVKMGVLTDELKVFLAFAIMIIAAIFIGMSTHNSTFIILAEAVLIIIFTMLGWFSFWILLLMALVFTLLILRKGIKGGNAQ